MLCPLVHHVDVFMLIGPGKLKVASLDVLGGYMCSRMLEINPTEIPGDSHTGKVFRLQCSGLC